MYCKKCGAQLNESDKFCRSCGEPTINSKSVSDKEQVDDKGKKKFQKIKLLVVFCAVVLITIVISVIIILNKKSPEKYQAYVDGGNKYIDELDYKNAEDSYNKAIKIDKKNVEPYVQLAELYLVNGDLERAYAVLDKYPMEDASNDSIQAIEDKKQELDGIKQEGCTADENSSLSKIVEKVSGYRYIGNTSYDTSIYKAEQYMPDVKKIVVSGFITANMYDYDLDGQLELMYIAMDSNTDSTKICIHILENTDKNWAESAVVDMEPETALLAANGNVDYFIKKYDDHIGIFVEESEVATYFSNGLQWKLNQYCYKDNKLEKIGEELSCAGSVIQAYLNLDPSMMEGADTASNIRKFVDDFKALGFEVDKIGYPDAIMEKDKTVIPCARYAGKLNVDSEDAALWMKSDAEELKGYKIDLIDFLRKNKTDNLSVTDKKEEVIPKAGLEAGTYEYSNGELYSTLTVEVNGETKTCWLGYWHNYGQSASEEDFSFEYVDGTETYEIVGNRSQETYTITITVDGDIAHIRAVSQTSSYSWDSSGVWCDEDYLKK